MKQIFYRCFIAFLIAIVSTNAFADEWGDLAKRARQEFPKENAQEKLDIVQKLGSFNKRESVDLLVSALENLAKILKKLDGELQEAKTQPPTINRQTGQIHNPPAIVQAKIIAEERLKGAVAEALGKINDPQAIKTMTQKLSHQLAIVRIAVAKGLIISETDEGIKAVKARFDKNGEREASVKILIYNEIAKKRSKKFISFLSEGLNSDIPQIQITAVEGLTAINSSSTILPLIEGLKGKDGRIKADIINALKAKTSVDKGEDSLAWKMWWESEGKAKFPSN